MMDRDETNEKYRAPALEKGLDIIELLAESVDGLAQKSIAQALDRSQSEIYRMLSTLVRRGYVVRSSEDDHYSLSLKIFALAQRHPPIGRLLDVAPARMRNLSRRMWQSSHLVTESNGDIVVVASVESPGNWGLALKVGSVIGLGNTGSGRVLAAFRSDEEIDEMIGLHRLSVGEPPLDRDEFRAHILRIREVGYERMPSSTTVGVTNLSFPVLDQVGRSIATLSCPFLERIDAHEVPSIDEVLEMLRTLARELTDFYCGTTGVEGEPRS